LDRVPLSIELRVLGRGPVDVEEIVARGGYASAVSDAHGSQAEGEECLHKNAAGEYGVPHALPLRKMLQQGQGLRGAPIQGARGRRRRRSIFDAPLELGGDKVSHIALARGKDKVELLLSGYR
jgi:hypothetical protein